MFENLTISENADVKACRSKDYNYIFRKKDGFFARWGATKDENPSFAPAAEILDIEVTTICKGVTGLDGREKVCSFCYKSNTPNGKNMSFETFKTVLDKFKIKDSSGKEFYSIMQIAFGGDSHGTSNPDLWKMMEYCREVGIVPNITIAEISDETADKLAKYCGAVAVSRYANKDVCYDSIKKLTDRGMTQVNIHAMVSNETYEQVYETLHDKLTDPRLEKLNAIVMLSLKQKGRGSKFNTLSFAKYKKLVDFALINKINVGFDSCGAKKFLETVRNDPNFKMYEQVSEPCESSCFSSYIDVDANFYPCSFAENYHSDTLDWREGLNVEKCDNFAKDIWNNPKTLEFRKQLLATEKNNDLNCRECVLFTV